MDCNGSLVTVPFTGYAVCGADSRDQHYPPF